MTTYVLGGGCFWCLDALYRRLKGVTDVESGYAGGRTASPNYRQVSGGTTGHAEVVQVSFDESVIPPEVILAAFFVAHDPTTPNRQGADVGTQYRSVMLYRNTAQKRSFEAAKERAEVHWEAPIVTGVAQLDVFYPAEAEHQDYYSNQPEAGYCQVVIAPKLAKARAALREWFKV